MRTFKLEMDEFLRSLKHNRHIEHSMLLGAGASIESGIQSAVDCIWDWKRDIYLSRNPSLVNNYRNIKIDSARNAIQNWLDNQNAYPCRDADEEYAFYAEQAFKIPDDRREYFSNLVEGKMPSLGYSLITLLFKKGMIKTIWTTNFDGLMVKACHQNNLTPIEVTLESQDRLYRNNTDRELLCISLHGDYKYGPLKNTAEELDNQSDIFIEALKHHLINRNLVIIGYSGRDKSLLEALKKAYSIKGSGRLYWLGYGSNCSPNVESFIDFVRSQGRDAYFIPADGFDKTLLKICQFCFNDDYDTISDIEKLKKTYVTNNNVTTSDFEYPEKGNANRINKIIKSNLYPITLPKTCLQFDINYPKDEEPWAYCKGLLQHGIIAVPGDGTVYAWGDKNVISKVCNDLLKTNIIDIPFTRESIMKKVYLREMLLRLIVITISDMKNLMTNKKNKIWDIERFSCMINGISISAYKGIELSIEFDWRYSYLTINPVYIIPEEIKITKEENKYFADQFYSFINNGKPNLFYNNYIDKWVEKLFNNNLIMIDYPEDSISKIQFKVLGKSLMVGLNSAIVGGKLTLPENIESGRIALKGIEYKDPQLLFYNPGLNRMVKDFHPMRGLQCNKPYDYYMNNKALKPSVNLGVLCPAKYNANFEKFLIGLNQNYRAIKNIEYVIDYVGFSNIYGVTLNIPKCNSDLWLNIDPEKINNEKYLDALSFANLITYRIEKLSLQPDVDVILIYIPKEYEYLTYYKEDTYHLEFDLHNYVKAFAAQKGISTQFIREITIIESELSCQIAWSLSLAIYVKALRTPWILSTDDESTAFAGIGFSLNRNENGAEVLIGCSHIYSSDGQGVKYKLSKITDVTYDTKKNPYLSENEAYQLGLNIKELFYKSFIELPKRVVVHKRTPFKKQEIKGIVDSLSSAGINNIDLVEITYEDNMKFFEYGKDNKIDGFPIRRGVCFAINKNTAYLYTHGIAPSVRNQYYKYIVGGKSIPIPLKIVKHYGNGSLGQIATEILGLSKMNWNSFELYSKLPCTIESSNTIAKIGWMLSQYSGAIYDYRYFM